MTAIPVKFAEASQSDGGIGAFNLNVKSFLFQLVTFVIVLLVLRRYAFPKLIKTIEERRKVLEDSLKNAKETEKTLASAEVTAGEILQKAREDADKIISEASVKSKEIVANAEETARQQAERIINEAQERIGQEHIKLRDKLKKELADLVVLATEKVLRTKLSDQQDRQLVESAIKELK